MSDSPLDQAIQNLPTIAGQQPAKPDFSQYRTAEEVEAEHGPMDPITRNLFQRSKEAELAVRKQQALAEYDDRNLHALAKDYELGTAAGEAKQTLSSLQVGTARTAGFVAALPTGIATKALIDNIPDDVKEAHARRTQYETQALALQEQRTALFERKLRGQIDDLSYTQELQQLNKLQDTLGAGTEEDLAKVQQSIDSVHIPLAPGKTTEVKIPESVRTTYEDLFEGVEKTSELSQGIDEFFNSEDVTKLQNSLRKNALNKSLDQSYKANEEQLHKAGEAWENGNYGEFLQEGGAALSKLVADGAVDVVNNPAGTWDYIVENIPQLAAGYLRGGLAVTNTGYGVDIYNKAVADYREKNNGALMSQEDNNLMFLASMSAAAAEQILDGRILKSLPGSKAAKEAVENAVAVTPPPKGLVRSAVDASGRILLNTAGEAVTEGYQTAVEEDLSKLESIDSGSEIFTGAVIGAASGGALSAAGETASGVGRVANRAAEKALENDRKAEAKKAERAEFRKNYLNGISSGDFSGVDTTSEHYDSVDHAWALNIRDARGNPVTDAEGNTVVDAEGNPTFTPLAPEESKQIEDNIKQLVKDQQAKINELTSAEEPDQAAIDRETSRLEKIQKQRDMFLERRQPEITEAVKAANAGEEVAPEQVERVMGSMRMNPDSVTAEGALAAAKATTNEGHKAELEQHAEIESGLTHLLETASMRKVHMDITKGSAGFLGMRSYQKQIGEALENGDTTAAEQSLRQLHKFMNHERRKAAVIGKLAAEQPLNTEEQAFADKAKLYGPKEPHIENKRQAALRKLSQLHEVVTGEYQLLEKALRLGQIQLANARGETVAPVAEPSAAAPAASTQATAVPETENANPAQPDSNPAPAPETGNSPAPEASTAPTEIHVTPDGGLRAVRDGKVLGEVISQENGTETVLDVASDARGQGVGRQLTKEWIKRNPFHPAGGFTPAGEAAYRSAFRELQQEEQNPTGELAEALALTEDQYIERVNPEAKQNDPDDYIPRESEDFDLPAGSTPVNATEAATTEQSEPETPTVSEQLIERIRAAQGERPSLAGLVGQARAEKFQRGINWIVEYFRPSKRRGLFQTIPNLFQDYLQPRLAQQKAGEQPDWSEIEAKLGRPLTQMETRVLRSLAEFHYRFAKSLRESLKLPAKGYEYDNPVAYLQENGALTNEAVAAMAMAAYQWLAANADQLKENDDGAIRSLLGMSKTDPLKAEAYEILRDVGTLTNNASNSIGKDAFKLLGLSLKDSSVPRNVKIKLQTSLGGSALLALDKMGYTRYKTVTAEQLNIAKKGRLGAQFSSDNEVEFTRDLRFVVPTVDPESGEKRELIAPLRAIRDTVGKNKETRGFMEKVFGVEGRVTGPKLEKPKARKVRPLTRTNQQAPDEATELMNIHESRAHTLDTGLVAIADQFNDDEMLLIAGADYDYDSSMLHRRARQRGKNLKLERDLKNLREFIEDMRENLNKPFYFTHNFWRQMRMGLASNTLNPQDSKIHRHYVNIEGVEETIDPTNAQQRHDFLTAVAEALDFTIDKKGGEQRGVNDLEAQLLAGDTAFTAAIDAARKVNAGQPLNEQDKADLIAGVQLGKNNFASLDALVNLARYLDAAENGTSFTSTMPREVDGVTNGIIIGTIQYAAAESVEALKTLLRRGGIMFKDGPQSLEEFREDVTNRDTYENIVPQWEENVANNVPDSIQKTAASALIGELMDSEGKVGKAGRTRVKQPLMVTYYMSGAKAVKQAFAEEILETLFDKIEAAVGKPNPTERAKSLAELNQLVADLINQPKAKIIPLDPQAALEQGIPHNIQNQIRKYLENNHGKALLDAINANASVFQQNATLVNKVMQAVFMMAKTRYDYMLEQRRETLAAQGRIFKKVTDLPQEEVAAINEELLAVMPMLRTYFAQSGVMNTYMPLAKDGTETNPNGPGVYSEYASKVTAFTGEGTKGSFQDEHGGGWFGDLPKTMADPGVGAAVKSIHALDAATMLKFLGSTPALNVHDAYITGVSGARTAGTQMNQAFFEVMRNYSIMEEAGETLELAYESFLNAVSENPGMLDLKQDLNGFAGEIFQDLDIKTHDGIVTFKDFRRFYAQRAKEVTERKNAVLDEATSIQQYFIPNGAFQPGVQPQTMTGQQAAKAALKGEHDAAVLGSATVDNLDLDSLRTQAHRTVESADLLGIFDMLDSMGTVREDSTHANYLRNELLAKFNSQVMRPFKLRISNRGMQENAGVLSGDEMFLMYQAFGRTPPASGILTNGIRMSMQETMAHETVHHVFHHFLAQDSLARRQVEKMWALARKHVKPTDLLSNPNDTSNLDDLVAAKRRWDYMFTPRTDNRDGSSNYLDEFVTFAMTNRAFMRRLEQIPAQEKKAAIDRNMFEEAWRTGNVQKLLVDLWGRLLDFVTGAMTSTNNKNMQKAINDLMFDMLNREAKLKGSLLGHLDKINTATNAVVRPVVEGSKRAIVKAANSDLVKGITVPGVQAVAGAVRIAGNNTPESFTFVLDKIRKDFQGKEFGFFQQLFDEMNGQTEDNRWAHDLVRLSNARIDQARQHAAEVFRRNVLEAFKTPLNDQQREALSKVVLKTDLVSLMGTYSLSELQNLLQDSAALDAAIASHVSQLSGPDQHFYNRGAHALGAYMARGHVIEEHLMFNADLIAEAAGTGRAAPAEAARYRDAIDRLATLYALKFTSEAQRTEVASIVGSEEAAEAGNNGITNLLNVHTALKDAAMQQLFGNQPRQFIKGYTKEIFNPHLGIKVGSIADEQLMKQQGYIRQLLPLQKDPRDPRGEDQYLYVSPTGGVNTYMAQAFSLTSQKAKGTAVPLQGAALQAFKRDKQRAMAGMWAPGLPAYNPETHSSKYAAPVFDDNGNVAGYRYLMSEHAKDFVLQKLNLFDEVIGGMAGAVVDRPASRQFNVKVLTALKAAYDRDLANNNTDNYVEISATSPDGERFQEIYRMMPENSRKDMRQLWGGGKFYVRKDLVDKLFGYRKSSVAELFEMDATEREWFHKVALGILGAVGLGNANRAITAERALREFVAEGKDIIVVRTGLVTLGNILSNIAYLRTNGVSLVKAFRDMYIATRGSVAYQRDMAERDDLQLRIKTGRDRTKHAEYRQKIVQLEDRLARNPVAPLMKEGVMQSIVEDVNLVQDRFSYKSQLSQKIEKYTDKVPAPLRTTFRYLTLAQDTQAYKVLNNAVRLSDFTARYALYQHQLQQGMPHGEAVSHVVEKFINFDIPTHKLIQWGNDHGLIWFSKYGIRIQKIIYQLFKDQPTEVVKLFLLESLVGEVSDIGDSLWGFQGSPFNMIGTPLRAVEATDDIATLNLLL